jgi:hypothetical protein
LTKDTVGRSDRRGGRQPGDPTSASSLCGKEFGQHFGGFGRILFGEEMAAFHRGSLDFRCPFPPDAQRAAVTFIEAIERATLSPEVQHRAGDLRAFAYNNAWATQDDGMLGKHA